ncbi:MAG: hypothetical protein R2758_08200 [Bacteroidales bacterium]
MVTVRDLQSEEKPVHPAAAPCQPVGRSPGTFKNVRYELAPNVRMLTSAQKSSIRLQQDRSSTCPGGAFRPSPDSVCTDPLSDLVLQAEPVDERPGLALRPSLSAVFDDIEVHPEQEVPLTLANTVSLARGVVESSLQLNNKYAVNLQFDSVSFLIDKVDNDSLVVTLVGQILLTNPAWRENIQKTTGTGLYSLPRSRLT